MTAIITFMNSNALNNFVTRSTRKVRKVLKALAAEFLPDRKNISTNEMITMIPSRMLSESFK
jgi:hypothetical protein